MTTDIDNSIDVYVGNGQAIEAQTQNTGIVLTRMKARKWAYWCECRYIDYVDGEPMIPEAPGELPAVSDAPADEKPVVPEVATPSAPEGDDADAPPSDFGTRLPKYVKGRKLLSGDDTAVS